MKIRIPLTQLVIEIHLVDENDPFKWPASQRQRIGGQIDAEARRSPKFQLNQIGAKIERIKVARRVLPKGYTGLKESKEWVEKVFWNGGEGELIQ